MPTPIRVATLPDWATTCSATAAASSPEIANAIAITRLASTPTSRAIVKSSAAARICTPIAVRWKNSVRAASKAAVTSSVTSCRRGMLALPSSIPPPSALAKSTPVGLPPKIISARSRWSLMCFSGVKLVGPGRSGSSVNVSSAARTASASSVPARVTARVQASAPRSR